ncbi:MAG: HAMP domain-containing protein, partial [Chloroflexia bacterium]|nr:HAMP domain-containing protein [Chloroflexia bacterium]
MFPSIRSFLAFSYTFVVLLVISVLGLGIQVLVERNLRSNLDADLVARARQVEAFILSDPDADLARQVEQLTTATGLGGQEADTTYLRVYIANGFPLPGPVLPIQEATPQQLQRLPIVSLSTRLTAEGVPFRLLTSRVVYNNQLLAYFQVMRSLEPVERIASRLRNTLAAGGFLAAVVAGATAYVLAYQALKPFSAIVEDSRRIGADRLDLRLPTSYGVDEVSRLASSFNSLLD